MSCLLHRCMICYIDNQVCCRGFVDNNDQLVIMTVGSCVLITSSSRKRTLSHDIFLCLFLWVAPMGMQSHDWRAIHHQCIIYSNLLSIPWVTMLFCLYKNRAHCNGSFGISVNHRSGAHLFPINSSLERNNIRGLKFSSFMNISLLLGKFHWLGGWLSSQQRTIDSTIHPNLLFTVLL